ncbi:MAG: tail fiber domain-containing protein, partial [Candidatus Moranbacteria bacterium]|nr:tail fiber domain-containing protein [Candidatus Moranbacteria bacterium]
VSGGAGAPTWFAPTLGSVVFAGASGALTQDNANFFFDDTNNRLGIGTAAPAQAIHILGTTSKLRLGYDASNYVDLSSNSAGNLVISSSAATQAVARIGDGSSQDTTLLLDGGTNDYYVAQDDTDDYFKIGSGSVVGTNAFLTITSAGVVQIGTGGAGTTSPSLFGFAVKSDTGDPAGGFEGAMYYNTFDNKFRCYQGSAWTDCVGSGSGGADTALSNLSAVAINTSLLPGTNDSIDLGSTSYRWRDLYLGGETIHLGTSTTDEATFGYDTTNNILNIGTDGTTNGDIAFFTDDLYIDKSTGYIGIGDATPSQLLTIGTNDDFTVGPSGTATSKTRFIVDYVGQNIALYSASAASVEVFSVVAASGDGNLYLNTSGASNTVKLSSNGSSYLTGGNLGLGDTTPDSVLDILSSGAAHTYLTLANTNAGNYNPGIQFELTEGSKLFTLGVDDSDSDKFKIFAGSDISGTSQFTMDSTGTVSIANLNLGAITFDENAGIVGWTDMSVTSAASAGTPMSYTAQIDGNPLLTVYSESDGAGSIQQSGVSIGNATLQTGAKFAVTQASTSTTASSTLYGVYNSVSDTGVVTATGDDTYGSYATVTRSGATGGTINTYGSYANINGTAANAAATANTYGQYLSVLGSTTGTTTTHGSYATASGGDTVYGSYQQGKTDVANTAIYGSYSEAFTGGTGSATTAYGVYGAINNNGTITTAYGLYSNVARPSGTITTGYGLYIADVQATTDYGIYQADSGDDNYFAGRVGIGDTTPDQLLEILSSAAANTQLSIGNTNAGDYDAQIGFELADGTNTFTLGVDDSDSDKFKISTTALGTNDRFVIDSTGKIGVGTSSPNALFEVYGTTNKIRLSYDGSNYVDLSSTATGDLSITSSSSTEAQAIVGSNTAVDASVAFDNSANDYFAGVDHTTGSFMIGSGFIVQASSSLLTVTSGGDFGIGTGATAPTYRFQVHDDSATTYAAQFFNDGNNANRYGIQIQGGADDASGTTYYINALDGDGGQVGYIANTSGTFALTDVSDISTKTNITDTVIGSASGIISDLRVVDFNRLADPEGPRITGFIAQEVEAVYPAAITTGPTGLLGIMKDAFIPLLVKAVQEQQVVIAGQGTDITELDLKTDASITTLGALQASVDTQLTVIGDALAVLGAESETTTASLTTLDTRVLSTETATAAIVAQVNATDAKVTELETQMTTLSDQNQALVEFFNTFELGNTVAKDAEGNVDLLGGTLKARILETGGIVVENISEEAPTIGSTEILPVAADLDADGNDDWSGAPMTDESVLARDGKSVRVMTNAMIPMVKGSRIFTSFRGNPGSFSWIEKYVDEDGEYVGFDIRLENSVTDKTKVDWWLIEQK